MKRWIALLLVVVAVFVALPAGAHDTDQADPNDTDGRLDLKMVELSHDATRGRWFMSSFTRWSPKQIWDQGYFLVYVDTKGNAQVDYYGLVYSDGRKIKGGLYRDEPNGKDPKIGSLPATKADARTAAVTLAFSKITIGDTRTEWGWSTQTLFTGPDCKKVCMDLVPDTGMVVQPIEVPVAPADPGSSPLEGAPLQATPNPEDIDLPPIPVA